VAAMSNKHNIKPSKIFVLFLQVTLFLENILLLKEIIEQQAAHNSRGPSLAAQTALIRNLIGKSSEPYLATYR